MQTISHVTRSFVVLWQVADAIQEHPVRRRFRSWWRACPTFKVQCRFRPHAVLQCKRSRDVAAGTTFLLHFWTTQLTILRSTQARFALIQVVAATEGFQCFSDGCVPLAPPLFYLFLGRRTIQICHLRPNQVAKLGRHKFRNTESTSCPKYLGI